MSFRVTTPLPMTAANLQLDADRGRPLPRVNERAVNTSLSLMIAAIWKALRAALLLALPAVLAACGPGIGGSGAPVDSSLGASVGSGSTTGDTSLVTGVVTSRSDLILTLGDVVYAVADPVVVLRNGQAVTMADIVVGNTLRLTLNSLRQVVQIDIVQPSGAAQ